MLSQLNKWQLASAAWAGPPEPSTSPTGHVEYSAELHKQFTTAYQAIRLVHNKMPKRFADEYAKELKLGEAILQEVVDTLLTSLKAKCHEGLAEVSVALTAMRKGSVTTKTAVSTKQAKQVRSGHLSWSRRAHLFVTCMWFPFAGDAAVEVIKNLLQDQTQRWQICVVGCSRLFAPQLEPGDSSLMSFLLGCCPAEDSFADVRELEAMQQLLCSCTAFFCRESKGSCDSQVAQAVLCDCGPF